MLTQGRIKKREKFIECKAGAEHSANGSLWRSLILQKFLFPQFSIRNLSSSGTVRYCLLTEENDVVEFRHGGQYGFSIKVATGNIVFVLKHLHCLNGLKSKEARSQQHNDHLAITWSKGIPFLEMRVQNIKKGKH